MLEIKFCFLKIQKSTADTHILMSIKKRKVKLLFRIFMSNLKITDYKLMHLNYKIQHSSDEKFITKTLTCPKSD